MYCLLEFLLLLHMHYTSFTTSIAHVQSYLMLNVLWSLGLDRPLAYFLVLLHNVFAEMYYYIFMCFVVYCICGRKINYVMLCYVTQRHRRLIRIADWSINTSFNEMSVVSHTATEAWVVFLYVSTQVFISKNNFGNNMYFGYPF